MPATTTTTEADVARMATIADATLADTFHWPRTEEERLYRDCPTAFWLAPDAGDLLPDPAFTTPLTTDPTEAPPAATGTVAAIGWAVAIAGPIFTAALGLVMEGPEPPIERIAGSIALALASFPLNIPIGAIAAFLPVVLGVSLLAWLGTEHPLARRRSLWAATGAGLGLAIAALFDAGLVSVPLVLTSIACATIARHAIDWIEPEFA